MVWELQLDKNAIDKCSFCPMRNGRCGGSWVRELPKSDVNSLKIYQHTSISVTIQHRSSDRKVHLAFDRNVMLPKDYNLKIIIINVNKLKKFDELHYDVKIHKTINQELYQACTYMYVNFFWKYLLSNMQCM